ncbi:LysR family transcriptional regulator [Vagococcus martis]|uniref:LysR family transcriptional regulator n=1 Tax=Vagococcus martis TaxID=1768210 RepID=A0A1V4DJ30_9ENTE|nr:LysR family transcriptional regulator [Vagococcus martis]OPF88468.1 LysR family transcriptional regulator [Vagococcus martis]
MFKLFVTFKEAYETRNFTKAAENLYISQPSVSSQIKLLEEELKCKLFTRKSKQEMSPTKEATILYNRLLNLEDDWLETKRLIRHVGKDPVKCVISASNTFSIYYLPDLMSVLIEKFPDVYFELEMHNSEEVLENVQQHRAHFGFIEKPLETGSVYRQAFLSDELVIAGDLTSELWLCREDISGVYHYTKRYFLQENIQPKRLCVKNNEMIIRLLEKGIGKSIISRVSVPENMSYKELGTNYKRLFYFLKKDYLTHPVLLEIEKTIEQYPKKKDGE